MLGLKTYQSHIWAVPKDDIYAAVAALTRAKEYALSFATQVQNGTAVPLVGVGKMILEQTQKDIKLIEDALKRFKTPYHDLSNVPSTPTPPTNPSNASALPPFGVKQESGLRDDFLSKRAAKKAARVPNPEQQFWTCRICLRSKFTRPGQSHRCVGGNRKRFGKYARLKGWDSCFIETPKVTSSRTLHLSGYWEDAYKPLSAVHSSVLSEKTRHDAGYDEYMNTDVINNPNWDPEQKRFGGLDTRKQ